MSNDLLNDDILRKIERVISERKANMPDGSYVTSLLKGAPDKILRKITEEAGELVLASKNDDTENIIHEAADLLFHMLVLLGNHDLSLEQVLNELRQRYKA